MGKFGPKNSKLSSLAENSHTECLDNVDSYSDIGFLSFEPKSFFGQIWVKKFKVFYFDWKLAHMVYWGCWFLLRQEFSELPTLNPFLGKFGLKRSKLFVLPENWHTRTCTHSVSKMLILISILVFSNFKPKSWGCWFFFWD